MIDYRNPILMRNKMDRRKNSRYQAQPSKIKIFFVNLAKNVSEFVRFT